jgi:hypothetical protein
MKAMTIAQHFRRAVMVNGGAGRWPLRPHLWPPLLRVPASVAGYYSPRFAPGRRRGLAPFWSASRRMLTNGATAAKMRCSSRASRTRDVVFIIHIRLTVRRGGA